MTRTTIKKLLKLESLNEWTEWNESNITLQEKHSFLATYKKIYLWVYNYKNKYKKIENLVSDSLLHI